MSNISDMIEEFLLDTLGEAEHLDISRNELANYFNVSPSQINYVLSTRFNFERGYIIESKRGGGGYVTIMRADDDMPEWINGIISKLNDGIDYRSACYILDEVEYKGLIDEDKKELLKIAVSQNALSNPFKLENKLRAQILRRILMKIKHKA